MAGFVAPCRALFLRHTSSLSKCAKRGRASRVVMHAGSNLNDAEQEYVFHVSPYQQYRTSISTVANRHDAVGLDGRDAADAGEENAETNVSASKIANEGTEMARVSAEVSLSAEQAFGRETDETVTASGKADRDRESTGERKRSMRKPAAKSGDASDISELAFSTHDELVHHLHKLSGDPLEKDGGRIVVHRGSPSAKLMLIGEAPGEQEDIQGLPFVGKAGQLLDKIFKYGGFDMERQVYITNIAKRRPMGNRDPTTKEISYYMPYVREEIRLIQPRLIVLAGRIAGQAMLGAELRITRERGRWFGGGEEAWMMPIYHPAFLLRFERYKVDMVTDIDEIRRKYLEVVPEDGLSDVKKR